MGRGEWTLQAIKEIVRPVRIRLGYLLWLAKGQPSGEFYFKKKICLEIASQYDCSTFIETGTGWGIMLDAVREHFSEIHSVEIYRPLYERARKTYAKQKNLFLYHGDSKNVLGEILKRTQGRSLFWLDGHYSGAGTGRGDTDCPLLMELLAIANHSRKDHCILIDDARLFGPQKEYPTIEQVTAGLRRINHDYRIEIEGDIIRALPPRVMGGVDGKRYQ